jgi:type III secretory pathway component EscU
VTSKPEKPLAEMTEKELEARAEQLRQKAEAAAISAINKIMYLGMTLRGDFDQ